MVKESSAGDDVVIRSVRCMEERLWKSELRGRKSYRGRLANL